MRRNGDAMALVSILPHSRQHSIASVNSKSCTIRLIVVSPISSSQIQPATNIDKPAHWRPHDPPARPPMAGWWRIIIVCKTRTRAHPASIAYCRGDREAMRRLLLLLAYRQWPCQRLSGEAHQSDAWKTIKRQDAKRSGRRHSFAPRFKLGQHYFSLRPISPSLPSSSNANHTWAKCPPVPLSIFLSIEQGPSLIETYCVRSRPDSAQGANVQPRRKRRKIARTRCPNGIMCTQAEFQPNCLKQETSDQFINLGSNIMSGVCGFLLYIK